MARKDGKDRGIVEKPKGSGKWWVRLYVDGRERWHKCDSKGQARTLYGRLKGDAREGKYFPERYKAQATPRPILLRDYFETWLKNQPARGKKPGTIKTYEWRLRKHVLPVFGRLTLPAITRPHIKTWATTLLERGLDYDTALNVVLTLSAVLSEALEDASFRRIPRCDPASC